MLTEILRRLLLLSNIPNSTPQFHLSSPLKSMSFPSVCQQFVSTGLKTIKEWISFCEVDVYCACFVKKITVLFNILIYVSWVNSCNVVSGIVNQWYNAY